MPKDKIKVLFVAAELSPIAKVGGLADVVGALPKALIKLGIDVRIVIPKYGIVDEKKYPLTKIATNITVPFYGVNEKINIFSTPLPGSEVPVYFIDNEKYLGGGGVYFEADASSNGTSREAERFIFLSRSCLEIFEPIKWYPDIVHCHDWHVGLVPLLIKTQAKQNNKLSRIKTVLSIHNLEYQGRYNAGRVMEMLSLKTEDYPTLSVLREGDLVNLQQAILISDYISTVSPSYAKEILTPEYGANLDPDLKKRKNKLIGILNGIDVDHFNPATDHAIVANFSAQNFSGKAKCKEDLQKICGLKVDPKIPVFGIVSRLAEQKGLDLIAEITDEIVDLDAQLVLLGTGLPSLEKLMREAAAKHPHNIRCNIAFDPIFAQKIYAGADFFLMPSKFEPCGLGQMIAMRYGTIPVVRATGGLKDTVLDYNPVTNDGDGFIFNDFNSSELLKAIKNALTLYQDQKKWYKVMARIMQKDFSWKNSANKYITLYKKTLN